MTAENALIDNALIDNVLGQIQDADPRFAEIVTSLLRHLHAFVRDVRPTAEEWHTGLDFLTRTGQFSTADRQEFILLSDVLGLTTLVDDLNFLGPDNMTPSSVEGPFHSQAAARPLGATIAGGPEWQTGERVLVHGVVQDCHGNPVAAAVLDIWQADNQGLYDTQDPRQPSGNLRALLTSDDQGRYWFFTIKPSSYPVPVDGPGGQLLTAMGRHPMRPAHLHARITAPGYQTLTTHLFVAADPYLASDAAFAVKDELVVAFEPRTQIPEHVSASTPEHTLQAAFDFHLVTVEEARKGMQ